MHIEVNGLSKKFNGKDAIRDLSFTVESEVFALVGPNGAGKTTTLRILAGILEPTSGAVHVEGCSDLRDRRRIIGYLPENPGLYHNKTAIDNLEYYAQLYGVPLNLELADMMGLEDRLEDEVKTYSKGMRQKLALIRALAHDPQILLLDEPTANLDPEAKRTVDQLIRQLGSERSIILSSHNLEEVERMCDRVAIIKTDLVAIGSPEEVKQIIYHKSHVKLMLSDVADADRAAEMLASLGFVDEVSVDRDVIMLVMEDPYTNNPKIVEKLTENNIGLVEIGTIQSTLEDAYVELVK